ncbi:class I SAM-dependent methyltransferase [Oleiharenicola lentus]|uniref:Class I SAM-dependent methyltransferase n=1 Tax=Oleiharenicola lentus TaxID=2508720 RepID=A0A4Q1C9L8_9BACT|nr:class I SAM-dependent methyltransferase [Oleiharenicola lentus]RXK55703.1 class I SAM-dependent methyltransferase [Oleiharenicola lentus]
MIAFVHRDRRVTLEGGQTFNAPREDGFRDTPSADLLDLIREIEIGRPWREAVQVRYAAAKLWLHQIITSPRRTAFFADVLPSGAGPVLEIGAGWGQIARVLAAERPVVALEPVAERLAFIHAAAGQDGVRSRLASIGADYFDIRFETPFAIICAIGVLEWVGAFQQQTDPQERQREFLVKIRRELAPGGSLVLGIENRLGLKYLLGCPDDHLGVPYVGCLPAALARRRWDEAGHGRLQAFTYSQSELRDLLQAAGFTRIEFFGAFPDYKLPEQIIAFGENGANLNAWLAAHDVPPEHNGYDGSPLDTMFQRALQTRYRAMATAGAAHPFAPSFFVRAS